MRISAIKGAKEIRIKPITPNFSVDDILSLNGGKYLVADLDFANDEVVIKPYRWYHKLKRWFA